MTQAAAAPTSPGKQMLSEQVYARLRDAIMRGDYAPGEALKPQDLAGEHGVSLAVVREALAEYVATAAPAAELPSIAGKFSSGTTDTAERVDELLWRDPHA